MKYTTIPNTDIKSVKFVWNHDFFVNKIPRQKDMLKWIMHLNIKVNFLILPRCIPFLPMKIAGVQSVL
jgi:hypothetical protein